MAKIKLELSTLALFNASDLYIDKTLIVQEPRTGDSSKWIRPLVFGAVGLAIGLVIIFLISLTSVIRTILNKRRQPLDTDNRVEEENLGNAQK